jgi:PhzF family phenazine biosynthesis protein
MQVDAFTDRPLKGNPCAIVFDADSLDDATMLAIAREMNLSETAFVLRSDIADVRARYFTPAEEIPLAGHPTIATRFRPARDAWGSHRRETRTKGWCHSGGNRGQRGQSAEHYHVAEEARVHGNL